MELQEATPAAVAGVYTVKTIIVFKSRLAE